MKSCLRNLFLFILIVGGGGVLFLGYLGVLPSVSRFLGSDKARDLGIKYTQSILDSGKKKTGVEVKEIPKGNTLGVTIQYLGQHKVSESFSSEELTAIANSSFWKYYPFSNIQIKVNKDGKVEASGVLLTERIISYVRETGGSKFDIAGVMQKIKLPKSAIPIYIVATGEIKDNKVNLSVQKLELGRIPIPQDIVTPNKGNIESFIQERMKFVMGLSVKSVKVEEGKLRFEGTLPDVEAMER